MQCMHYLNAFQRDMLVVIAGLDDPKGTEITSELEDYYPEEITAGRVYPQLTAMAEKGLIKKGEANSKTNFYRLRKRGVRELKERRNWEARYLDPIDELSVQGAP